MARGEGITEVCKVLCRKGAEGQGFGKKDGIKGKREAEEDEAQRPVEPVRSVACRSTRLLPYTAQRQGKEKEKRRRGEETKVLFFFSLSFLLFSYRCSASPSAACSTARPSGIRRLTQRLRAGRTPARTQAKETR